MIIQNGKLISYRWEWFYIHTKYTYIVLSYQNVYDFMSMWMNEKPCNDFCSFEERR